MDKKVIRKAVEEAIDNQIRDGNPPETKQTLDRLIHEGWSQHDARMLIGQCVIVEIFDILKNGTTFDEQRYIGNLHKLPEAPFEDED